MWSESPSPLTWPPPTSHGCGKPVVESEFVASDYETIGSESGWHRRVADRERAQVLAIRVEEIDRPIVVPRILSATLYPQPAVPSGRYPPHHGDFAVEPAVPERTPALLGIRRRERQSRRGSGRSPTQPWWGWVGELEVEGRLPIRSVTACGTSGRPDVPSLKAIRRTGRPLDRRRPIVSHRVGPWLHDRPGPSARSAGTETGIEARSWVAWKSQHIDGAVRCG